MHINNTNQEWTPSEIKLLEHALAEFDMNSPNLFENIRSFLPGKTIDQIKSHFERFKQDVKMIENDHQMPPFQIQHGTSSGVGPKTKGVPWTEEEHKCFLKGLDKCGKGAWVNISMYYVPSKTPSQVASHAQKYFRRSKCTTPMQKRRYSIHDIRLDVNSNIVETFARRHNPRVDATEFEQASTDHEQQPDVESSLRSTANNDQIDGEASSSMDIAMANGSGNNVDVIMNGENSVDSDDEWGYKFITASYEWIYQANQLPF